MMPSLNLLPPLASYHFSGVAGAGMSPLALLMRARGHQVQGSDRAFDQGRSPDIEARLRRAGVIVTPHDGSGLSADVDRFGNLIVGLD
jgi:UDP-N-acetylmuramate--alanine ligase